ncbi:EAL-associated domain-containing protein [Falsibacillus pallidus]|uniref:EAL domain-containing protein n=1 Tax=Falsibacillus pallidus TaxID=493781 RepID=UPI003D996DE6
MDPLEILTKSERVVPFFQAIFSADEHRVIGYEILGRFQTGEEYESLGPFFQDVHIPEEFRVEIDNLVLTKALEKALISGEETLLFINRELDLLMADNGEQLLSILQEFEERGLSLNRIVLEISEGDYDGDITDLNHFLRYLKTMGIKIALDKMGEENGQLDRISQLSPDILKVDLKALRSDIGNTTLKDILFSISLLARKVGASLLFTSIEMDFQLQFAWLNGGRYYQGFFLHKPNGDFTEEHVCKKELQSKFEKYIAHEKNKLAMVFRLADRLQEKLQQFFLGSKKGSEPDQSLKSIAEELEDMSFRLYICDENGIQQSSNYFKKDKNWIIQAEYKGKNWSWRPYFLENIVKMNRDQKGLLSDLYSDLETGQNIRTFSYPLKNGQFLFIDLSYEFLYEQEGLLR